MPEQVREGGPIVVVGARWVTVGEAAGVLGVGTTRLVSELSSSRSAVLVSEDLLARGYDPRGDMGDERRPLVPVRMVPGCGYLYTRVLALVPRCPAGCPTATPDAVLPASHVLREALEPWLASRAAVVLGRGARTLDPEGWGPL